jgi:predicted AlkP superfamily phosphohydrolase/phosphomutase
MPIKNRTPLVIFGFDAADGDFVTQWVKEGHLPAIASIIERGCWRSIEGKEHICELGSWLTLFSSATHNEHCYYDCRQLIPGTYDLQNTLPHDAKALPFWNLLGRDKEVAIIDPPEAYALPGLSGIQLSNWTAHQTNILFVPAAAQPDSLLKEVCSNFGLPKRMTEFKPNSSVDEDYLIYKRLLEQVKKKGELCLYLLAKSRFDLIVIGFGDAHIAGHRFWKYHSAGESLRNGGKEGELRFAIREVYSAIDRQIGILLAQLPSESNVFVLSAYGMKPQYPTSGLMESFCRQLGYQASPDASSSISGPLDLARRILPKSWRVKISEHLPSRVQERLIADLFRSSTNWRKTTAFALPSLYTSYLRINLRGREPLGTVEPGPEYKELMERLETDLNLLIDPKTGKSPLERITNTGRCFECGTEINLPDIFIEWRSSNRFLDKVLHPRAELTQQKIYYNRDNFHSLKGFFAAAGPCVRAGGAEGSVSILDLAPTFLSLLDRPAPGMMRGEPLDNFSRTEEVN